MMSNTFGLVTPTEYSLLEKILMVNQSKEEPSFPSTYAKIKNISSIKKNSENLFSDTVNSSTSQSPYTQAVSRNTKLLLKTKKLMLMLISTKRKKKRKRMMNH